MLVFNRLRNQEFLVGHVIATVLDYSIVDEWIRLKIRNGADVRQVVLGPGGKVTVLPNCTIEIVRFGSGGVKLGVDAPKQIPVHRREVHDAITHTQSNRHVA